MNGTYIKNQYGVISVNRIKRLSTEILNEYKDKFGTDFSTNKQFLNEVSIIRSKGLKNKIAGYITKILQRKQKFEDRKQQLIENDKKLDKSEPTSEPEATPEATPEPTPESYENLLKGQKIENTDEKKIIEILEGKNIVAIFQGASEAGPRALGNRSFLFDPRVVNGKNIVNKEKKREWFRPFAGTILEEDVHEWFDLREMRNTPYMMYAVNCKPDRKSVV